MSKGTDVSPDQERLLKEGWEYVKQHSDLIDKLVACFKGSDSREISPEQDQEVRAILEQVKNDATQGSRDLTSANVSSEDQERVAAAAIIAGAHTAYKVYQNPTVKKTVKKVWNEVSSWF
ncbi:hypothetical protein [Candidatus Nitrosocosmicus sp. R]